MNPLRERWDRGQPAIGVSSRIPEFLALEVLGRCGFDYVAIDCQHGGASPDDLTYLIAAVEASGSVPIVRVASNEPAAIQRVLDLGGSGVIVPDVTSATEASAAVAACRYPPQGRRSFGQIRGGYGSRAEADREVLCIVMIESVDGLRAREDIVAVPGVDAVYFGTIDMALSMGIEPEAEPTQPRLVTAMEQTVEACRTHGVAVGRPVASPSDARRAVEDGFHFLNVGLDLEYLRRGATADVAATRSELERLTARGEDHCT